MDRLNMTEAVIAVIVAARSMAAYLGYPLCMQDGPDDKDWPDWAVTYVTPGKLKRTYWDSSRVKHDPEDKDSKDWADSEPDPDAP